jgi:hypothetical protein
MLPVVGLPARVDGLDGRPDIHHRWWLVQSVQVSTASLIRATVPGARPTLKRLSESYGDAAAEEVRPQVAG